MPQTPQQIEAVLNSLIQGMSVTNSTLTNLNETWLPQPQPDKPTIDGQLQTLQGQFAHAIALVNSILQKEGVGG